MTIENVQYLRIQHSVQCAERYGSCHPVGISHWIERSKRILTCAPQWKLEKCKQHESIDAIKWRQKNTIRSTRIYRSKAIAIAVQMIIYLNSLSSVHNIFFLSAFGSFFFFLSFLFELQCSIMCMLCDTTITTTKIALLLAFPLQNRIQLRNTTNSYGIT